MSKTKFDGFVFYRSYREALNGMTKKDQLETLLAIVDYALYGKEPNLKGKMPTVAFTIARPIIDSNNAKRTAGQKGGRPKKETNGFQNEEPDALYNEEREIKNEKQRNKEQKECVADKPPTRPRFVPPTLEEVTSFVQERGSHVDPQGFLDFYEAKGWKIGSSPMKDWKAACRNAESWERWEKNRTQRTEWDYLD